MRSIDGAESMTTRYDKEYFVSHNITIGWSQKNSARAHSHIHIWKMNLVKDGNASINIIKQIDNNKNEDTKPVRICGLSLSFHLKLEEEEEEGKK